MIGRHGIGDLKFSYETAEAHEWYDPLKPYTKLEYEWVQAHVDYEGAIVADVGCHHGNYAVVFKGAAHIICVDQVRQFCDICRRNLELNYAEPNTVIQARMGSGHGISSVTPYKPDVYKMDIEGTEFEMFPNEFNDNPQVHTWIIEIHPAQGNPDDIARIFKGFKLLKVDREQLAVVPYEIGSPWKTHATLIAKRFYPLERREDES